MNPAGLARTKTREGSHAGGDHDTLLHLIADKERELDAMIAHARGEAEAMVRHARGAADALVRQAREQVAEMTQEHERQIASESARMHQEAMAKASHEVETLRRRAR